VYEIVGINGIILYAVRVVGDEPGLINIGFFLLYRL